MNESTANPPRRCFPWVGLVAVCLLDIWWRGHTIGPSIRDLVGFAPYPVASGHAEPLDCDECAYAYIGSGITHGAVMYRDLSENKPPLGYWLYALAVGIGGANELAIRLMPVLPVVLTIGLIWSTARRLRGEWAALLASLIYVLLSTDPFLYGNGANMEHFLNLFGVAGLAAFIQAWGLTDLKARRRWIAAAGALVALGALVKQVAAIEGPVFALALLMATPPPGSKRWRRVMGDWLALVVGFAVPCLLALSVILARGAGPDALADVVGYGSALATIKVPDPGAPSPWIRWLTGNADPAGHLPPPFGKTRYLVWWGTGSWPIWLVAVPSILALGFRPGRSAPDRIVAAWTVTAAVEVILPGLYWQHYYLLPTPGLALVVALAASDEGHSILRAIRARRFGKVLLSALTSLAIVTAVGETVRLQVRDYLLVAPEDLTAQFKGGGQWVVLREMGREIGRRAPQVWTDKSPTLYIWGWQSPLHFYSGLRSPTRHFFADPLLEDYSRGFHQTDPRVRTRVERIAADLVANPPGLILVARPPFTELRQFLLDRGYRRSTLTGMSVTSPDGLGLWVDRDHFAAFERLGQRQ